jgi:Diaphanous FH3 Domain
VLVTRLCPLTLHQTLRYIRPPESLITQLDVYTEEKFEDEEDMRERVSNIFQAGDRYKTSELASTFEELVALTRSRTEEHDKMVRVLKALIPLFQPQSEKYGSQQLRDSLDCHTLLASQRHICPPLLQPFLSKLVLLAICATIPFNPPAAADLN